MGVMAKRLIWTLQGDYDVYHHSLDSSLGWFCSVVYSPFYNVYIQYNYFTLMPPQCMQLAQILQSVASACQQHNIHLRKQSNLL